jgi:hypothetical protein
MHAWIGLVIAVVLICLAVASFFVRRRGESGRPRPGWQVRLQRPLPAGPSYRSMSSMGRVCAGVG